MDPVGRFIPFSISPNSETLGIGIGIVLLILDLGSH
jgi:hypothetical protein